MSILLIAIGAILAFAVSVTVSGINLATVGVILMIAGAVGLLVDLLIWAPRRRTSTLGGPYAGRTRLVAERETLR